MLLLCREQQWTRLPERHGAEQRLEEPSAAPPSAAAADDLLGRRCHEFIVTINAVVVVVVASCFIFSQLVFARASVPAQLAAHSWSTQTSPTAAEDAQARDGHGAPVLFPIDDDVDEQL